MLTLCSYVSLFKRSRTKLQATLVSLDTLYNTVYMIPPLKYHEPMSSLEENSSCLLMGKNARDALSCDCLVVLIGASAIRHIMPASTAVCPLLGHVSF